MDTVLKKSLGAPLRQLTSCVTGVKDGFTRKSKTVCRKSVPCCYGQTAHDSSWIRAYQAELHRERNLRQVKFAQKNAEKAALRSTLQKFTPLHKETCSENTLEKQDCHQK